MGELLFLAAAFGAGYMLARIRRPGGASAPAAAVDPAARLQALGATLAPIGEASSHPRDLASHPVFQEAIATLRWGDVPMRTVLDYAAGANWILATVACAALCERDDLEAGREVMVRQFRHLSPWPMYYALQYFTKLEGHFDVIGEGLGS